MDDFPRTLLLGAGGNQNGLHIQQQMLTLPRADHLLIGILLRRFDVAVELDETLAEKLLEIRRGTEFHYRVQNVPRQLMIGRIPTDS